MVSVLLVEDETELADMLCEVLQTLGHTARHVATGAAALEVVDGGWRPDVVITDIMIPGGLSGLALAQALRARIPGLPVVLSTGGNAANAEIHASGLHVLRKPFRTADLETAIRAAIQAPPAA